MIRTGDKVAWAMRGFNPHHPKDPSYYPLLAHLAQTGQILRLKKRVELRILAERMPPESEHPKAFEDCNVALLTAAREQASILDDDKPLLLTVWNGNPGDGLGGTEHALREWTREGLAADNIDISKL